MRDRLLVNLKSIQKATTAEQKVTPIFNPIKSDPVFVKS